MYNQESLYRELILPFAKISCIAKPEVVSSLSELYDFVIPMVDVANNHPFATYYQIDIDLDKLAMWSEKDALKLAVTEMQAMIDQYIAYRSGTVRLGKINNIPFSVEEILRIVLFKVPHRTSVIGSFVADNGVAVPTFNLKLPRSASMHISPVARWPEPSAKVNTLGSVTLFGIESRFFVRKAHISIMRHVSKQLLQEEFSKAMKAAFPMFAYYSGGEMPWEAKLIFNEVHEYH